MDILTCISATKRSDALQLMSKYYFKTILYTLHYMSFMSFDFRFMNMNKTLRNRRNIAKKVRWYTYSAISAFATNSPRELDFVLNDSCDNVLYPINRINE